MRVIVAGAGAIGGYLGARLALAGHAVTLVGRQPLADAVAAQGLTLIEPDRRSVVTDCRVVTSMVEAFSRSETFDLALITVKTYDTHAIIEQLRPYAQAVGCLLSLQNGVSSETLLGAAFGCEKVVAGTILNPVSVREPGVVVLEKRRGGIGLAFPPAGASAGPLVRHFGRAGFTVRPCADAYSMKWSKLILNLIGNASSAILDLNTMEIFADKRTFSLEIEALREALRVASADGVRFVGLPGYPVPLLVAAIRLLPLPLLQPILGPFVARGRGAKMPSLHVDLHGGKSRSEIDELNGAVVRLGERLGIRTPANALLVKTFTDLQARRAKVLEWKYRADRLWAAYVERAETVRA